MKISKKTVLNIVLILFVLSFFVTPIGYYGKIWLNRLFSFAPSVIEKTEQEKITDYEFGIQSSYNRLNILINL